MEMPSEPRFADWMRTILPFGAARALALAFIPIFQIAVAHLGGRIESGRFFQFCSLGILLSQLADLGLSRGLPLFFSPVAPPGHLSARFLIGIRWVTGLILIPPVLFWGNPGETPLNQQEMVLIGSFILGRVVVLGYQGFHHAREQFSRLWWGAWGNVVTVVLNLFLADPATRFTANVGMQCLCWGLLVEGIILRHPQADPGIPRNRTQSFLRDHLSVLGNYALLGVAGAVFTKVDALVACGVLANQLGEYGRLDAWFKMAVWPSYVTAQALFPALQRAWSAAPFTGFSSELGRHFRWAGIATGGAGILCLGACIHGGWDEPWALFWFALYGLCTVPNAILLPTCLVVGRERALAVLLLSTAALRFLIAGPAGRQWGLSGIAMVQAITAGLAGGVLWIVISRKVREKAQAAGNTPGEQTKT